MPRLEPVDREALSADLEEVMEAGREMMGYTPNDGLTMAHKPELLHAVLGLTRAVYGPGTVDIGLKKLIGLVTSSAAGCRYCTAHTALGADNAGLDAAKLDAVWDFASSPLFDDAERAALRIAQGAGLTPNVVTDADFEELRRHWDSEQIAEIVGVISLFGFLNRWNSTLATELESTPADFAEDRLARHGWTPGAHRPDRD